MEYRLDIYSGYVSIRSNNGGLIEVHSSQGKKLYEVVNNKLELVAVNPEDTTDGLTVNGIQVLSISTYGIRCRGSINTSCENRS